MRSGKLKVRKMINENLQIRPLLIPTVYSIGVGGGEWGVGGGEWGVGGGKKTKKSNKCVRLHLLRLNETSLDNLDNANRFRTEK